MPYCSKCDTTKRKSEFYVSSITGRVTNYCKACTKEHGKRWYNNNKEIADKKRRAWQDANREKHIEHVKKYCKTDKFKIVQRRYYENRKARKLLEKENSGSAEIS